MAKSLRMLLLAVVVPVAAHAFQLGASSGAYDRVALCARLVDGGAIQEVDERLAKYVKELEAADEMISMAKASLEKRPDSAATTGLLAASMELKNTVLKIKLSLEAEKKELLFATGPFMTL